LTVFGTRSSKTSGCALYSSTTPPTSTNSTNKEKTDSLTGEMKLQVSQSGRAVQLRFVALVQ
jgi:hypothetical protein